MQRETNNTKAYYIMKKKSRLTAQRIASCERIMKAFRDAPVIITTQVADGTIGKCVHSDGMKEVMFIPLDVDGQHYRAMRFIRQLSAREGRV